MQNIAKMGDLLRKNCDLNKLCYTLMTNRRRHWESHVLLMLHWWQTGVDIENGLWNYVTLMTNSRGHWEWPVKFCYVDDKQSWALIIACETMLRRWQTFVDIENRLWDYVTSMTNSRGHWESPVRLCYVDDKQSWTMRIACEIMLRRWLTVVDIENRLWNCVASMTNSRGHWARPVRFSVIFVSGILVRKCFTLIIIIIVKNHRLVGTISNTGVISLPRGRCDRTDWVQITLSCSA